MDDYKEILFNYLLSVNDKTTEEFSDINNKKENLMNDNSKKEYINNKDNFPLNLKDTFNNNSENDNRKVNILNLPLNNEINNESKISLLEDLSYKDIDKKIPNNKIIYDSKNNIVKENDIDYNKCFKNRMDIMQAVLDDELNISSDNNFIKRRTKSTTTLKVNEYKKLNNIKLDIENNDNIKYNNKEEVNEQNDQNITKEIYDINSNNNIEYEKLIKEEEKEKSHNSKENIDLKLNNEEEEINFSGDIKIKLDNKKKEKKEEIEDENKILKENIKITTISNILETPKKEEKINIYSVPKNINKITEEINFEIFNNKTIKNRKGSYIDINFKIKDINIIEKDSSRINSERIKKKENLQFKYIKNDNNKSNNNHKKIKNYYNKSFINIKEYKNNNNLIKNKDKNNSALPITNRFFSYINNKNNIIKKEDNKNIFNNKEKFPESLDNLINKIKKTCENKNNNSKGIKKVNNNIRINKKIKEIQDSLEKMNDIHNENDNLLNRNNKFNSTNKKQVSLNKVHFNIKDYSYQPLNKNISRNFVFSKKTESSDFILNNKNNNSLPSKKIIKRNSYSNLYTLNSSPIRNKLKKRSILNINSINIDSLQLFHNNLKIKNIFEDFDSNYLLNNINISERKNSQGIKEDKKMKNKKSTNNKNNNINISQIRLYYTSEKRGNKNKSNISLHKANSSNFKLYINKIDENNLIKEYTRLNNFSKYNNNKYKIDYIINRNNYKNDNIINNDKLFFVKNNQKNKYTHYYSSSHSKNSKYICNDSNKNNKSNIKKNNKINNIQNYSKKTNDYFLSYKNYNFKDMLSPFEKIRRKKIHSIFPVNPFDEINYIKEKNFMKN